MEESRGSVRNHRLHLDLNAPRWIQKLGDDDHGCRWTDIGEKLAVYAPDSLPVFDMREVHAGADHVLERRARLAQRFVCDRENPARLCLCIAIVSAHWPGSRMVNDIAHAHRAREPNDRLEGRSAADVLPHKY